MKFKSGLDLEDAIFGRHSDGAEMARKFYGQRPNFDKDVRKLIRNGQGRYPNTFVGRDLFWGLEEALTRKGINTNGLVFLTAIGSMVDLRHFADGIFFLPAIDQFPATIDAFNINNGQVDELKDKWVDLFAGQIYGFTELQNDLFRFKVGFSKWLDDFKACSARGLVLPKPADLREYTDARRPENHFVLIPQFVRTRAGRRSFAINIAEYLVSKVPRQDMALLSHI